MQSRHQHVLICTCSLNITVIVDMCYPTMWLIFSDNQTSGHNALPCKHIQSKQRLEKHLVESMLLYTMIQSMIMSLMRLNQQQNSVRVVTFNFAESPEQVFSLRLLMSSDQAQKHVRKTILICLCIQISVALIGKSKYMLLNSPLGTHFTIMYIIL